MTGMADYVATERAYHGNTLIEPGAVVPRPDGKKLPRWLKPAKEAAEVIAKAEAKRRAGGDTKPRAAQAAVKAKAAQV